MPSRILCPECSAPLRLAEAFIGKTVQCPRCALTFTAKGDETILSEPPPPLRSTRRREADEDRHEPARPPSRAGLWIGLLSALCIALLGVIGYLLFVQDRNPSMPVVQAPPVPRPIPQPDFQPLPPPAPNGPPPNIANDFADRFGGAAPEKAIGNGERVKLSNPRYQKDGFTPFEKLCVDYEFNDGRGLGPRVGLVMVLKSGNQLSEATLFGLVNDSGTIGLDSFGLQKIPSGTEIWLAEGFGFGRFAPPKQRVSNIVVVP